MCFIFSPQWTVTIFIIIFILLVGFEVVTRMVMKSTIFWDTTPCSLLKVNRRFDRTYRLHPQVRINRARYQRETRWQVEICLLPTVHSITQFSCYRQRVERTLKSHSVAAAPHNTCCNTVYVWSCLTYTYPMFTAQKCKLAESVVLKLPIESISAVWL
jgi:hypothetical protein